MFHVEHSNNFNMFHVEHKIKKSMFHVEHNGNYFLGNKKSEFYSDFSSLLSNSSSFLTIEIDATLLLSFKLINLTP